MGFLTYLNMETLLYFISFLIGCMAATAELLSRYKKIRQIVAVPASWVYLAINGVASCCGYYIVAKYEIAKDNPVFQVLIAGTSALVILRSSVASIKIGDKQTDIGVASILQVFLNTADRAFDQTRSESELSEVEKIMSGIDFEKAKLALPTTCFTIMKNVPEAEQKLISEEVNNLSKANLDDATKSLNLGIILTGMTDLRLLKKAVAVLQKSIQIDNQHKTKSQLLEEALINLKNKPTS
jgi:hypothetical protein